MKGNIVLTNQTNARQRYKISLLLCLLSLGGAFIGKKEKIMEVKDVVTKRMKRLFGGTIARYANSVTLNLMFTFEAWSKMSCVGIC